MLGSAEAPDTKENGALPAAAEGPRPDDVLPDSLGDALLQAGQATHQAMESGVTRCLVEVLLPEFWDSNSGAVFAEEGDQQRFWKLTRRFVDSLAEAEPDRKIRIVYPDSGVAAMLQNSWKDGNYRISSLTDRLPVNEEDDLVVLAAPDPQGLEKCKKIALDLEDVRPLVLFNPRLASGDVGVGLNVRRMRSQFLGSFNTTYCMRPVGDIGTVFRRYPGMWQVFVEDLKAPGRFSLVAEKPSRPAGEALDELISDFFGEENKAAGKETPKPSIFGNIQSTVQSLQRFAKQLSQ